MFRKHLIDSVEFQTLARKFAERLFNPLKYQAEEKISMGGGGGKLVVSKFLLKESSDGWLPNISCLLLMRTTFSVTRPCMFRRKRRYFKHVHQTSIQGKKKKQSRTTSFVLKVQRTLLVRVPRKIVFTHEGT